MRIETIHTKNVRGQDNYHIKLTRGNLEPIFIKIGEKNYKAIKEMEKQPELPLKPQK